MFENLKDAIRSDAPPTPSRSVFLQQARVDSTLFGFFIDCRQLDIKRRIAVRSLLPSSGLSASDPCRISSSGAFANRDLGSSMEGLG